MPFILIDTTNDFNPIKQRQFATEAEAETAATQELEANPKAVLAMAKLLKQFRAKVTVSAEEPAAAEPEISPEEEA